MNRGSDRSGGYTIVETLIFLAVSGAMLIAVMTLMSGQQGRTQFVQAVRDFESKLQDVSNDVSTGYSAYPLTSNCRIQSGFAGRLYVQQAAPVSASDRCTFVGRVVALGPNGNKGQLKVISVLGRQQTPAGQDPTSIQTAGPVALAPGTSMPYSSTPDYSETVSIGSGATVESVVSTHSVGAFGFFSTFQGDTGGFSDNGAGVDLYLIDGTTLTGSSAQAVDRINNTASYTVKNPTDGIVLCLKSGTSDQIAWISIGGGMSKGLNTGRLSFTSRIEDGGSCS